MNMSTLDNTKEMSLFDTTAIKRVKKVNLSERDLETIFKNYQKKKQKYGRNKNLMTEKR